MTLMQLCIAINEAHANGDRDTLFTLLLDFGMRRATKKRRDIRDNDGIRIREDLPADMVQEFVLHVLEVMHTFDQSKHKSFAHWLNTTATNNNADVVGEEAKYYSGHAFANDLALTNDKGEVEGEGDVLDGLALAHGWIEDEGHHVAGSNTKVVAEAIIADPFMLKVAVLRDTEEHTDAEIAEKLGVTLDMLKGRVKRFTARYGEMVGASERTRRRVRHEKVEKKVA